MEASNSSAFVISDGIREAAQTIDEGGAKNYY